MAAFIRRRWIEAFNPVATRPEGFDLPTHPLSAIILSLTWTSPNPALFAYQYWLQAFSLVSRLTVTRRGLRIVDGSLANLAVAYALACGWLPISRARGQATNNASQLTVPICFGRRVYDPIECLPGIQRGDLQLTIEASEANAAADSLRLNVETIELPDAQPERFLRTTQTTVRTRSGEQFQHPLPNNARILGLLLRDANPPGPAQIGSNFGDISITADNVERGYLSTSWDSIRADMTRVNPAILHLQEHVHATNNTSEAAPLSEIQTTPIANLEFLNQYAYIDFDPLRDGSYLYDTTGIDSPQLRGEPTNDSDTDAQVVTLELAPIPAAA